MVSHDPSKRYCIIWSPDLVEIGVNVEGREGVPGKLIIGFGRSEDDVFLRVSQFDNKKSGIQPGDVLRTLMLNPDPKYDARTIITEAARMAGISEEEAWDAAYEFSHPKPTPPPTKDQAKTSLMMLTAVIGEVLSSDVDPRDVLRAAATKVGLSPAEAEEAIAELLPPTKTT